MAKHHHLVIAGTGRTGTSFLVRYLTALGLDTILSRQKETAFWNEQARAGLEDDRLVHGNLADCPYVIKSPWLYEYVEEFFGRADVQIDGLILPIRRLEYVACSRVILELQAIRRADGFPGDKAWKTAGYTPGGAHFSLDPLDHARLLATGLHKVLEVAVSHDVPILFLDFSKLTRDPAYLFGKLRPYLPASVSPEQAALVHATLAKEEGNRTEDELAPIVGGPELDFPSFAALDTSALKREIGHLRQKNTNLQAAVTNLQAAVTAKDMELREAVTGFERHTVLQGSIITEQRNELDRLRSELEQLLGCAEELRNAQAKIGELVSSRSWRVTAPLRSLRRIISLSFGRTKSL